MNDLLEISKIDQAISNTENLIELLDIRDVTKGLSVTAEAKGLGEIANRAKASQLKAERKAGVVLAKLERGTPGPKLDSRMESISQYKKTIQETNLPPVVAHRWQQIATIPEEKFTTWINDKIESGEELTQAGALRLTKGDMADVTRINAKSNNDWFTPSKYIDAARLVMGSIDLDPASQKEANVIVQAGEYFTAEDDGLIHDWFGNVWLNPPYGGLSKDFVSKLIDEYAKENIEQAILLVTSNATDTTWFTPLWHHILCFTNHRINFYSPNNDGSSSTHGSVFVYFGGRYNRFAEVFSQFGAVVTRYEYS